MSYASAQPPIGFSRGRPSVPQLVGLVLAAKALHRHHGRRPTPDGFDESPDPRAYAEGSPFPDRGGWPFGRPPFGGRPSHHGGSSGGPFQFGPPWGGGSPKARRGDIRTAILAVLADGPRNGYQVIGEIAERSGGVWRPSPGSIYPTLSQLEDEGLVRADESTGRRLYELTDAGRTYVAEHPEEMAAPWETMKDAAPDEWHETFGAFKQVAAATWQVMHTGTEAQRSEARQILADARRELYRVLGEGGATGEEETTS